MSSNAIHVEAHEVLLESSRFQLQRTPDGFELIRRDDHAKVIFKPDMTEEIERDLIYIRARSNGDPTVAESLFHSMADYYRTMFAHSVIDSEV